MRTTTNCLIILCSLVSIAALAQESESIVVVTQHDLTGYWTATKEQKPHYPRMAFNNGKQGCAVIGFVIDSDGTTSNHQVLFSYPDATFNRAAINAYKEWKFEPASLNEKRDAVFTSMTATFTWIDKEQDQPEVRQNMTTLCDEEGVNALHSLVRNSSE